MANTGLNEGLVSGGGGIRCALAGRCSGCGWIERSYESQRAEKLGLLRAGLREAGYAVEPLFFECGEWAARDRVDLTLEEGRLGLFANGERSVIPMSACPMMSERLENWLKAFAADLPPQIKRGSVRLRVAPSGARGIWLDFANLDVKALLDEATWLKRLYGESAVEIGQKRKRLVMKDGSLRLADPVLEPWFETYTPQPVPLLCAIGSFTQPGFAANRVLVGRVAELAEKSGVRSWLELGAGIGNFTVALAGRGHSVVALEMDGLAVQALQANTKSLGERVRVLAGDYRRPKFLEHAGDCEGLLCDPPRSGLGPFLNALSQLPRARTFIYVSCFLDSFLTDCRALKAAGYELRAAEIVDQFPQSPHFETVALFVKS
ncbi:MAG TPA: rRNA adenine N-6-methyltransferase family protein [Bdellovibrionales bacterium]|nr:rRNA adenine N-6-methyltransferase family protein [Bdellovibrionales bacterium]